MPQSHCRLEVPALTAELEVWPPLISLTFGRNYIMDGVNAACNLLQLYVENPGMADV